MIETLNMQSIALFEIDDIIDCAIFSIDFLSVKCMKYEIGFATILFSH